MGYWPTNDFQALWADGLSGFFEFLVDEWENHRQHTKANDAKDHIGEVVFDDGLIAKKVTEQHKRGDPQKAADNIVA